MKTTVAIILACFALLNAHGQPKFQEIASTRSRSGQFIVYGVPQAGRQLNASLALTNASLVKLEPPLLAASCERIKQEFLSELSAPDQWRGKIKVFLYQARSLDDTITVTSSVFNNGWTYQVEMPDVIEPGRLVRAMVPVLMLEMANRNANTQSAEIPTWLAEGFSRHLQASSEIDLVVQPPQWTVNKLTISPRMYDARKKNSLSQARERLRNRPPLTLEELSSAKAEQLSGEAGEVYRSSAQLFVYELLHLKNGRAYLRAMIGELAHQLNWQTAILRAFHSHFERQLDLEKWWALQSIHFTGHELAQTWPKEESWKKLNEVVRPTVEVRFGNEELPFHTEVTLQAIIREWDFARQSQVLRAKSQQLQSLQLRLAPESLTVANGYWQILDSYLQKMEKAGLTRAARKKGRSDTERIVEYTVKQLDAMDAKRDFMQNSPVAVNSK